VLAVVVSIDPDIRRIARWQESRPSAVVVLARLVRGETFSVDRAVAVLLVRHGYATMIGESEESRPSAVVVLARLVRGEAFSVDRAVAALLVRHGYATMIGESVTASRKGRDALAKWDARPPGTR